MWRDVCHSGHMAERMKAPTIELNPDWRYQRYDWEAWQDGGEWVARKGEDFLCSLDGFRSSLYTRATRTNMRVKAVVDPVHEEVRFRFYPDLPRFEK